MGDSSTEPVKQAEEMQSKLCTPAWQNDIRKMQLKNLKVDVLIMWKTDCITSLSLLWGSEIAPVLISLYNFTEIFSSCTHMKKHGQLCCICQLKLLLKIPSFHNAGKWCNIQKHSIEKKRGAVKKKGTK